MTTTVPTRGLTVSFVVGVIVRRDGVSNNVLRQVGALTEHARRHRYPLALKIYTTASQVPDARVALVESPANVAADRHFQESDVVLYNFAIYTPLFDSIHLAGPATKKIVYFHGITYPMLVHAGQRATTIRSYEQAVNLHAADQVLVTSRFLMRELAKMGVPVAKMVQTSAPIDVAIPDDPPTPRPLGTEGLRLLYIGRLVPAKGVLDLLAAIHAFRAKTTRNVRLDLAGSKTFSDPAYVTRLQDYATAAGLAESTRFHFDAPTAHLARLLGEVHALVIPSYHEGFCVPVVEAFARGCFVLCSDAGALPETSGRLGRTFPMANVGALAVRLEEFVTARDRGGFATDGGFVADDEWARRARAYVAALSPERIDERFCDAVLRDLPTIDPDIRRILAQRRRQLLLDLHAGPIAAPVETAPADVVRAALAEAG